MGQIPKTAIVLGAGLGLRMRPLTQDRPKPLVHFADRPMIDYAIDALETAGVETVVVNVHYLADQLEAHLKKRKTPKLIISDERDQLLDTGGGVKRALPLLGDGPFYIHNSDSVTIAGLGRNLENLAAAFDPARMDSLLLLSTGAHAIGYQGEGDFAMDIDGKLSRRVERRVVPFVFTGVSVTTAAMFKGAPDGTFSLNQLWNRSIENERLFGLRQDGFWMHLGSTQALAEAERHLSVGESYF